MQNNNMKCRHCKTELHHVFADFINCPPSNDMLKRFGFNNASQVIEIASNDGYLLQYFKEYKVPVLGIDPTANTAEVAIAKGIPTIIDFFGAGLAQQELADKKIK